MRLNTMLFFTIMTMAGLLVVETPDTLQTVTVVADKGVVVSRTDTVIVGNSSSITELLQKSPGLYIGDYGGAAGLKTVSLRGMGSAHTAIYIDGVRAVNAQSGQVDLGAIGPENLKGVVIDYAQNSLSFMTARPVFNERRVAGRFKMDAGAFGSFLPFGRLDFKLSDNVSLSANATGIISRGNFPLADGGKRDNNDIRQIRAGVDLFGAITGGDWHAKINYNGADRGTPGSVSWPSEDRQRDRNGFIQGLFRKQFTNLYSLNLSAKAALDDISYKSSWGDSRYFQKDFQVNSSHKVNIGNRLSLSLAADIEWAELTSDSYSASRTSATANAAAAFKTERFKADLALEYDGWFDKGAKSRNCLSPSLDLRFTAFRGFDVIAFGRRAYRVPMFNDLYYVGYGNPDLKPEDAWLTDIGVQYNSRVGKNWTLAARLDGFMNFLDNKIISTPTIEDPNIWLPYNIGKLRSSGVDVSSSLSFAKGGWKTDFSARYSWQSAVDRTPDSDNWGKQIAYIARHTVILGASTSIKGWSLEANWNLRDGRRDSYGEMPGWNTLDARLGKSFKTGNCGVLSLSIKALNMTDVRYELATGYPMPGRSFNGGIEYRF